MRLGILGSEENNQAPQPQYNKGQRKIKTGKKPAGIIGHQSDGLFFDFPGARVPELQDNLIADRAMGKNIHDVPGIAKLNAVDFNNTLFPDFRREP